MAKYFAFYQTQHLKNRLRHLTNANPAILLIPMAALDSCPLGETFPFPGLFRRTYWILTDKLVSRALQWQLWVSLFLDLCSFSGARSPIQESLQSMMASLGNHLGCLDKRPVLLFIPHPTSASQWPSLRFSITSGISKGNWDWELFPASSLQDLLCKKHSIFCARTKWEVFLNCSLHSFAHLEISIYWEPTRCKVPYWGWKVTREEYREGPCPGGADALAGGSFSGASDPRAYIFTIQSGLHTIRLP